MAALLQNESPRRPAGEPAAEASRPGEALLRRLTGSLAHNLNNRLTGVVGCLELAQQEAGAGTSLAGRLETGLRYALQAADMVRRMVAFAFRPSDHPSATLLSLGRLAGNTARRIREEDRPGLTVVASDSSRSLVRGNPVLMQMALEQLVNNALEAMPAGGTLALAVYDEGPDVCLVVADTGGGLLVEAATHLFEPFVTTKGSGHLGLGLVLCRDLAQAQGGTLRLNWEAGKGTTATLTFPTASEDTPALSRGNGHTEPGRMAEALAGPPVPGPLRHVI